MNVIEFHQVGKKRKSFTMENMNMTIPQGYITGFIGPNGSGKTTTIHMMMDILNIDEGNIKLFGDTHKNHHLKQKIGFVYDDLYVYENLTIEKMMRIIAPLYETWNDDLFYMYLNQFELPLKKKVKRFSKGMKMKCSLLFALAHEPELLIMDEPTAGLDPIFRRELLELLQELMVKENKTIFLSTHITTDLDRIADYIIFINEGKVILQKSMEEMREQFHVVKGRSELLDEDIRTIFIDVEETNIGFNALFEGDPSLFADFRDEIIVNQATIEDVMYFMMKKERN